MINYGVFSSNSLFLLLKQVGCGKGLKRSSLALQQVILFLSKLKCCHSVGLQLQPRCWTRGQICAEVSSLLHWSSLIFFTTLCRGILEELWVFTPGIWQSFPKTDLQGAAQPLTPALHKAGVHSCLYRSDGIYCQCTSSSRWNQWSSITKANTKIIMRRNISFI